MDALQQLVSDANSNSTTSGSSSSSSSSAAVQQPVVAAAPASAASVILVAGCVDWDNATNKAPAGLEVPHAIRLGVKIVQAFSSSSSLHCFFLAEGKRTVFAMGKNDRGQLALGGADNTTCIYPREVPLHDVLSGSEEHIVAISTGRSHTLLLTSTGFCFGAGANTEGQLGMGDTKTAARDSNRFTKIPSLSQISDISCGYEHSMACDDSGKLYTWGHPQYGCLGFGSTGSYMKEGGKGAAIKFQFVYMPREVNRFVQKDSRDKIIAELSTRDVRIGTVAAGKNHSICLEKGGLGRVFTCGFGGYGRLGHNSANDETLFREVTTLQQLVQGQQVAPTMPQKQICQIIGGSSFSMAISKSQTLYFWGKLANSARGEATTYPTANTDLTGWHCRQVAGGSNSIIVAADDRVVAWGVPVAGKWGLEGGAKSTVGAKFVTALDQLRVIDVSAGYAHVSFLVNAENPAAEAILDAFPVFEAPPEEVAVSGAAGKGKKRAAAPADNAANKKKSAGKK